MSCRGRYTRLPANVSNGRRYHHLTLARNGGRETAPAEDISLCPRVAAQGNSFDWFELYNGSERPVDLAGLVLADDLADTVRRVPFPAGFLEAGSYQQIHLDKDGWPGFALGRGEELGIWTLDGMLVDRVDWEEGQADRGTSFARVLDITGDFQTVDLPTPGAPNLNQTAIIEKGEECRKG